MSAFGAELWGVPGSSRPSSQLRLRKTNSGFAVTDTSDRLHRNALEKALKTMGILLLPLGIVLLLAPSGQQSQGIPIPGIGLAAAMAIVGFALFVYAGRGFGTELRIDSFNREIKIGTVNAKGDFSLRKTIAASETQSLFLMRAAPPKPARLCMRSKKGGNVIKIINGSEEELIPVLERITEAFRPKHMADKRVRTRVTGAFIHATFV